MKRSIFLLCLSFLFSNCKREKHITFSEHIAPIVFKHCTPCHRPGSAGTFDLLTYDDVKKRASTIAVVTQTRSMPPWPADASYSHFLDEKVMTDEEIQTIKDWIEQGSVEGDKDKMPPLPQFPSNSLWGKPDMVLTMKEAFHIEGNNKDHFFMMKIPFELPQDTFIKTVEIVPGNKKLLHHVNGHLVQYDDGIKKDIYGGKYFVNTEEVDKVKAYETLDIPNDDGSYPTLTPNVTNYLPGVETSFYPEGIGGYRVKKKSMLLLDNLHYGPSPVDATDSTTFNIFFDNKPARRTLDFIMGTLGITSIEPPLVIQPNRIDTFRTKYTVPIDMSLLTVNPHMHLLGKTFLAYAIKPGGDTIRLIKIPRWDFRWQYFYTFDKMLKIPKGTTIYVEGVYDNTTANPLNPFNPPQVVAERAGSMRTTDEMFQFIVTYVHYKDGDENISLKSQPRISK
jgi:hypothetical protein